MGKLQMVETDRARMEPDVYDGPECDQHRPRWIVAIEKEDDEDMGETLELEAKRYPPGTQVIIQEPLCPKCGEIYENCMVRSGDNPCDFDWKQWADEQYS